MVASIASALISCFSSAVVASLCTLAIERFGGTIGGILASSPTTIIVFSIGQTLSKSIPDVQHALYAVPCGIASNAVFLIMWREIPDLHVFQHAACLQSLAAKLALIVVVSLSVWTICATLMLLLLNATQSWNWNFRVVGIFFFLVSISFGIAIASWKYVPSPKGNYKPHWFVYVLRGVLAGVAVGSAVLLSRVSDFISGIASAFPAILMTSMVSLWISQGTAVQGGAVAPLILGTASVSGFALSYAELLPLLAARVESLTTAACLTALISYTLVILFCSLPSVKFLQFISAWHLARESSSVSIQVPSLSRDEVYGMNEDKLGPNQTSAIDLDDLNGVDFNYYPDTKAPA